ncbi:hypothetical protein D3C84_805350 [compost metagenome]
MLGDADNLARRGGPVLAGEPVAATDRLCQLAFAVDQCHRHTVDLGLNPDIASTFEPGVDSATLMELSQAGVGDGVSNRATCRAQGFGGGASREAFLPFAQSQTGLIIEFVGDQGAACAMIAVVPEVDLFLQCADFGLGASGGPVGAFSGLGAQTEKTQYKTK